MLFVSISDGFRLYFERILYVFLMDFIQTDAKIVWNSDMIRTVFVQKDAEIV